MTTVSDDKLFQTIDLSECKEIQQPIPIEATHCRKGVYVIMKDCPCKVADLKVSKTGKHGHAKANMTGYDIITGKKYQETVPGHISMFTYQPQRTEYEVASIADGLITAMTADGQELFFNLPDSDKGKSLLEAYNAAQAAGGEKYFNITVLYAPRMAGKKWMANLFVEEWKEGKE